MRESARMIIIDKDKILLMHRVKDGKEYYVLPGGGIEEGETPLIAVAREIKEETNLDVEVGPLMCKLSGDMSGERKEHYFVAKSFSGDLALSGPEKERQSADNKYSLEWIPLDRLGGLTLYPDEIKKKIMDGEWSG